MRWLSLSLIVAAAIAQWSVATSAQDVPPVDEKLMPTYFTEMIDQFATANPKVVEEWTKYVTDVYTRGNGYYIDPMMTRGQVIVSDPAPVDPATQPYNPDTNNGTGVIPVRPVDPIPVYPSCFSGAYYANGYSVYGYDQVGYDPYGYDVSGYDIDNYSREGAEQNAVHERGTGILKSDPSQHVEFDLKGRVMRSSQNIILRYNRAGYDQYGYDVYGNYNRPVCPIGGGTFPPIRVPISFIPITWPLRCRTQSESASTTLYGRFNYIRKSTAAMTAADWTRFRNAWNTLNDQGGVRAYQTMHMGSWQQHNTVKFSPWHREFLARIEDALHRIDNCVFLPYWDVIASPAFPAGIVQTASPVFPPPVKTFAADGVTLLSSSPVTRALPSGPLPNAATLAFANSATTYTLFNQRLEQFHNGVHVHVGGDMGTVPNAPKDPVFYMHHANIDRLWWLWQQTHASEPSASVITSINPLRYSATDTKTFADVDDLQVVTVRGSGYTYI